MGGPMPRIPFRLSPAQHVRLRQQWHRYPACSYNDRSNLTPTFPRRWYPDPPVQPNGGGGPLAARSVPQHLLNL